MGGGQQRQGLSQSAAGSTKLKLGDDILYKTWPTVAGFSFAAKAWGEIIIRYLFCHALLATSIVDGS